MPLQDNIASTFAALHLENSLLGFRRDHIFLGVPTKVSQDTGLLLSFIVRTSHVGVI